MTVSEAVKSNNGAGYLLFTSAINQVQSQISNSEQILFAITANVLVLDGSGKKLVRKKSSGVFAITDQKVIFSDNQLGMGNTRTIDITSVQSFDDKISLTSCVFKVVGLTDVFEIDCNKKHLVKMRQAMSSAKGGSTSPQLRSVSFSPADELKKFKELLDANAITQEEYDEKKRQLLKM